MLRAVIADDEPLGRRALVRMLQGHPDVVVVAECADGESVMSQVEEVQPNLLFLDIRMPGMDGLQVAGRLFRRFSGAVIFVTAHDDHALEAFNLNALDYLMKPFTPERLDQALNRVRERVRNPMPVEMLEHMLTSLRDREAKRRYLERIPANRGGRIHLVSVPTIERIDAMGNYAKIHAKGEHYDIRDTLQSLEERLDPEMFLRVHRSTIINMDYVREVQTWFRGGHQIVMKDGTPVRLSRYQTSAVERLTGRRRPGSQTAG